ncbi:MAG: hypothetical protein GY898_31695 [Proteobacteria bacterium]|nr:hypothetical protein [Pseudomonadota bacterium]
MTASRPAAAAVVVAGIATLGVLHYTAGHDHDAHYLYRRLFYLPILAAAWWFGLRGGLIAAAATVAIYLPHAVGAFGLHVDPSPTVDKAAEVLLYVGVGGLVGLFVDRERGEAGRLRGLVTDLQTAQTSLAQAEHQAALGHLTAGLAHEIRNPLGSIRGSAEILGGELDAADREHIAGVLVRETERLDGVLTRFLRFAGQEPPTLAPTNLSEAAAEVAALAESEAKQHGVTIDAIGCSATPNAMLDGGKIRQLLLNLVINAIQAQPDGGRIRIVSGVEDGGRLPLFARVEDAGPGLADESVDDAFHPYFTTREGGTGLGLAIARRTALDHGGQLTVRRSPLGGACFELRLPLPEASDA